MKRKTLNQIILDYVEFVLIENGNNKTKASKILGISARTIYNYTEQIKKTSSSYELCLNKISKIKNMDFEEEIVIKKSNIYILRQIRDFKFPTNEQRVKYINKLINADRPFKNEK